MKSVMSLRNGTRSAPRAEVADVAGAILTAWLERRPTWSTRSRASPSL